MTAPEKPAVPAGAAPIDKIKSALTAYRVMAWATGIWLIALCYEMVVKYILKVEDLPTWLQMVPFVHGWVYLIYLVFTANLAMKVRWPVLKTIGVLLSGTIPLAGVIVEHFQTKALKARFGL